MNANAPLSEFPSVEWCLGAVSEFSDTQPWIYHIDNPYLHGVYAPITQETEASELVVEGELPTDLAGAYFRNGPNPLHEPRGRYHTFDGDGMVHGVYFADGKASYRNRYVETHALIEERQAGVCLSPGMMQPKDFTHAEFGYKDTANTDVFCYGGDVMTLWYNAGNPYRLDAKNLATKGFFDLEKRSSRRLSAHSKVDWRTGEFLFFDYGDEPPYMTYGVANAAGQCIHEVAIDLPGPRLPHDLGFTENYTVLHDLPFFHDQNVLRKHKMRVVDFHKDIPTRFGIIPRYGQTKDVRWFECQPCYILHVSNCWEEGDWVVMDGCRSTNPKPCPQENEGELAHMLAYMRLEANNYRWKFNLRTGEVREGDLDDLNTEFNKTNPLFHGVKSRYAYHQRIPLYHEGGFTLRFTGLVKYDNATGQRWQYDYGKGVFGSEAVFAPRSGASRQDAEDDGYVITLVTDSNDWRSWCLVFDATDIEQGPIAKVLLPHRVPAGFHATWARAEDMLTAEK